MGGGGGRSPCCDKNKVKKGPWSPAEDLKLVSFIQKHGHPNWRSLPNQAGLLRCGKSCRLRWINYLRPDVKRGNFTPQEESSIIRLHATFGNKWSKIASKLPGRTDNEIKNIWNTHLKKRSLTPMINADSDSDKINQTPALSSSVSDDGFTNQENSTHNLDHPKEAAGGIVLIQDIDQPSTPSSANSGQHHHKLASCACHTTSPKYYLDKENLEIADLESEVEFWNMLEPELIINDHEMEVENWVRLLEDELGLEGPCVAAGQQIDKDIIDDEPKMNMSDEQDIDPEIWCQISDEISPFWPNSPQNFGFC